MAVRIMVNFLQFPAKDNRMFHCVVILRVPPWRSECKTSSCVDVQKQFV
jgi:hypothetical protein